MASLVQENRRGKVSYRLQWYENKRRKSMRLGIVAESTAEQFCVHIEELIEARDHGRSVGLDTSRWLRKLGDNLHSKLAERGFVQPRRQLTLDGLIRSAIESKPNWKPSTREKHEICGDHLIAFFGDKRDLRTISEADAGRWREAMLEKLARSTVSKMVKQARFFFKQAVADNVLETNPFGAIKAGSEVNSERLHFVSREVADKVMVAAPDVQWRAIIALARYGGLRTPSETLRLRWSDINWERGRMLVRSIKTEHHEGKASRITPLFPELLEVLREAFEQAPEGTDRIIHRYREGDKNLRTEMGRIIDRAGVKRWPRIFQNLRASRETELCREFPLHVVTAWLGNTPKVAEKHYLDVTEEDFAKAAAAPKIEDQTKVVRSEPTEDDPTAQNTSKGGANMGAIGPKVVRRQCCTEWSQKEESPQIAGFCDSRHVDATYLAPPTGDSQVPKTQGITGAGEFAVPMAVPSVQKSVDEWSELAELWDRMDDSTRNDLMAVARGLAAPKKTLS